MVAKFDLSTRSQSEIPLGQFNVSLEQEERAQSPELQYGYTPILNRYRDHIDNIKAEDWKKVRWYINEYDFLVKDPIINRAFYKYWEIVNEFDIFESYEDKNLILHCAEAPGGFIQGTNIYLQVDRIKEERDTIPKVDTDGFMQVQKKRTKRDYRIYTISLNKDLPQYKSYNLPSYNKNITNKQVCITYGKDNTGDINNWDNIHHIKTLSKDDFYLITADGGFDEGTDFNNKEQLHYCLILSEIYSAITLQKQEGHFILKVFDIFTETSAQLLYLLSLCYSEVYIYKPKTSRPTNSEKYVVCKRMKLSDSERSKITAAMKELSNHLKNVRSKYASFKLFSTIPEEFTSKIKYMNETLLSKQCQFLERAVELCNNQTFIQEYDSQLQSSIDRRREVFHEWEELYNLNTYV
jgi:23S rRNA U2552 (ribose-2'-O)-methylase RlmE/FtsJ